jgi:chromosome segregation ATPase
MTQTAIDRPINRASLPRMTKLPISIAVTAAIISTAACDRNKIKREAEDVREAREEVHEEQREQEREVGEAKAELEEAQADLSLEVQKQINGLEERYLEIQKDAASATARLEAEGTRAQHIAEIEQARTLARTRIDDARKATNAEAANQALAAAEQALDVFERKVDDYGGNV